MSYQSVNDLPKSVRNLPKQAKNLYLKAFNAAWEEVSHGDEMSRDKQAHEAAWIAVKREYEKDEETGEWLKISDRTGRKRSGPLQRQRRR
jgi:cation transport regulator